MMTQSVIRVRHLARGHHWFCIIMYTGVLEAILVGQWVSRVITAIALSSAYEIRIPIHLCRIVIDHH